MYVHTHAYPLAKDLQRLSFTAHGTARLDDLRNSTDTWPDTDGQTLHDCIFVDCETTGLSRMDLPFMIGVATYDTLTDLAAYEPQPRPDGSVQLTAQTLPRSCQAGSEPPTHFVIRQLFALHPGEEGALLEALQTLVATQPFCVTFNGRAFDIALLRQRYQYHQIRFPELPLVDPFDDTGPCSLDLLSWARRLWRRRIGSCALVNCAEQVLGLQRTHADVHGAQIPGIYHRFLATGQSQDLTRVFYHNRQDIIAMAFLLERIVQTMNLPPAQLNGEDAFALAQIRMKQGDSHRAVDLLQYAIKALTGSTLQATAFHMLAQWHKRQGDWDNAVRLWEEWLSTAIDDSPIPYIELAKFHEWQNKDLEQAAVYTQWALYVSTTTGRKHGPQAQEAALQHRLRRVHRKQATQS